MFKIEQIAGLIFLCSLTLAGNSQVSFNNNNPVIGRYVGFNSSSTIDLPIENGGERIRCSFENWTGLNGLSNSNANRIAVPVDPTVTINPIFSMMHLGDNTNPMLRRPWMNVGTSYIESGDLMYVGLMERPVPGSINITDAVIGWGCNDDFFAPAAGPDNLRFLFLSPTDTGAPDAASQQGRETMRITPNGNIGMGAVFSNASQPLNRLEVNARTPQLRLSHTYNSIFTVALGLQPCGTNFRN